MNRKVDPPEPNLARMALPKMPWSENLRRQQMKVIRDKFHEKEKRIVLTNL